MKNVELSIIVPVYNEEENLEHLIKKITQTRNLPAKYEVLFVDDGSTDKSIKIIEKLTKTNKKVKLISFTRNFGQQVALTAGMEHAMGNFVGIIDADLQDPPKHLIKMYKIAKKKDIDIVYAVRIKRKENPIKKFVYKVFYSLYSIASESPVDTNSGDFSVISRSVVDEINSMPEKVKFIRGLRSWVGYSSLPYAFKRPKRLMGKPKYTWRKLYALAINGIISTSTKPLRVATIVGIILSMLSLLLAVIYTLLWVFSDLHQEVPGFLTIVVLILLFSGLQMFTLGILGEYIATIFHEVKGRPAYLIKRKINI